MTFAHKEPKGRRERIIDKVLDNIEVDDETGCWNWLGGDSGSGRGGGYGRMYLDGQTVAVHIVAFVHYHGYIPSKKQIDHICENRKCCNPAHLDLVSHIENQRRKKFRDLRDDMERKKDD